MTTQPLEWITLAVEDPDVQIKVKIKKLDLFIFLNLFINLVVCTWVPVLHVYVAAARNISFLNKRNFQAPERVIVTLSKN